eukprot:7319179-Karenia_brevis.AAC.1
MAAGVAVSAAMQHQYSLMPSSSGLQHSAAMHHQYSSTSSSSSLDGRMRRRLGKIKQQKKIEELKAELATQSQLLKTLQTQCELLSDLLGEHICELLLQNDAGNSVSVANPEA